MSTSWGFNRVLRDSLNDEEVCGLQSCSWRFNSKFRNLSIETSSLEAPDPPKPLLLFVFPTKSDITQAVKSNFNWFLVCFDDVCPPRTSRSVSSWLQCRFYWFPRLGGACVYHHLNCQCLCHDAWRRLTSRVLVHTLTAYAGQHLWTLIVTITAGRTFTAW